MTRKRPAKVAHRRGWRVTRSSSRRALRSPHRTHSRPHFFSWLVAVCGAAMILGAILLGIIIPSETIICSAIAVFALAAIEWARHRAQLW